MLDLFEKKIGGVIKKYVTKLRGKFKKLTNVKKLTNQLFKTIFTKIRGLLSLKPKSIDDYLKTGSTYIAKKIMVIGVVVVLVVLFIFNRYVMPWAEGRLWIPEVVVNSAKYHSYSGKAKVVTDDRTLLFFGEMQDGRITGAGSLYDSFGNLVYRGDFLQEKYHGAGERYDQDGSLIYQGQFAANAYHGEGQLYENGYLIYEGEFASSLYHGEGQLYENGQLIYDGEFRNGLYHGKGNKYHDNGNLKLSGNFSFGNINGEGKLYNRDGRLIYQGFFLDGLYDGVGIEYSADTGRTIYEGQFGQGLYHGLGKLYDRDMGRLLYDGQFQYGGYSGSGSLYNWKGQNIYTGYFFNGEIDYLRYIDKPVTVIRDEFGPEDKVLFFNNHFLLSFNEFQVLFSYYYPEEDLPIVNKIILLGEQDFFGAHKGMRIADLIAVHGESYSEFYYLIEEEKKSILDRLRIFGDVDELYSVRYIVEDEIFIRYYALDPQGEILYFEMGGL